MVLWLQGQPETDSSFKEVTLGMFLNLWHFGLFAYFILSEGRYFDDGHDVVKTPNLDCLD